MAEKKKRRSLNTFVILLVVLLAVSIVTWIASGQTYTGFDEETGEAVEMAVQGASLSDILMAPLNGWHDAGDVIGFVFCLGIFLSILTATGALETGIQVLVKALHGKELVLVWILMFLFSIGGTTYGMGEETVGFYILLAATMMAAGFDPMVGAATVLLGAGSGVLGSTLNPFATGAAVAAAGVDVNMGTIFVVAIILWLGTFILSALFVTAYAKKVKDGKGSILTAEQISECKAAYGTSTEISSNVRLTGRQKGVLIVFAFSFLIMILGFIPWGSLNEGIYNALGFTSVITGSQLGDWYFNEAATWFLLMGFVMGFIGLEDKKKLMPCVINGFTDMISVNLVIALARATTVIMSSTGLGAWLVEASITALTASGLPAPIFGFLDYVLHVGLSFLVPSSSGLAGLSSPIVAGMGWSVETSIMINVAANGFVNLFTPTCGFIMGGLALARIPWDTWVKWSAKLLAVIAVFSAVVLTVAMMVLS